MKVIVRALFAVLMLHSISAFSAESFWPTAIEWAQIRSVIQSQLDAFQQDDDAAAYDLAAPSVKERFPNAEAFSKMVRNRYTPIYNPRDVKFLTPSIVQGRIMQGLQFLSDENQLFLAMFTVEKQSDKTWKIKACELMPVESRTAL
jgi:Domain of unknown function (DUF4864)